MSLRSQKKCKLYGQLDINYNQYLAKIKMTFPSGQTCGHMVAIIVLAEKQGVQFRSSYRFHLVPPHAVSLVIRQRYSVYSLAKDRPLVSAGRKDKRHSDPFVFDVVSQL
ncbi:hypothetical protein PoB_005588700 [Plakobranchus ocellatus]|uniref:Uncharacterized protein n=1 Tax=Plakobranchus ocellatus TaxID=259542 RepID=A0AAV4CCV7_9GAST|nr:hypothetical protein PoB_005588700 [Plakobranchus ocellatus]